MAKSVEMLTEMLMSTIYFRKDRRALFQDSNVEADETDDGCCFCNKPFDYRTVICMVTTTTPLLPIIKLLLLLLLSLLLLLLYYYYYYYYYYTVQMQAHKLLK